MLMNTWRYNMGLRKLSDFNFQKSDLGFYKFLKRIVDIIKMEVMYNAMFKTKIHTFLDCTELRFFNDDNDELSMMFVRNPNSASSPKGIKITFKGFYKTPTSRLERDLEHSIIDSIQSLKASEESKYRLINELLNEHHVFELYMDID